MKSDISMCYTGYPLAIHSVTLNKQSIHTLARAHGRHTRSLDSHREVARGVV